MTSAVEDRPTCSIVLPTFNRAHLVGDAIESVLQQTLDDWELLVVDDGSTDDTSLVVERYRDRRIVYVRQEHRGRSVARNRGAELARSDLLGFLDSDDRLLPHALTAHRQVFEAQPDIGMTVGGYQRIDEAGEILGTRTPWTEDGDLTYRGWFCNCFGVPGSVMIQRGWLERVKGFGPEFEPAEDWDLFLRLAIAGCPMTWVRESVLQYRSHPGNSTRALQEHLQGMVSVIERLARSTELPLDGRSLIPRALAWTYAVSACRAIALGADEHARRSLQLAREAGGIPAWRCSRWSASPEGFESLLEPLLAELVARSRDGAADLSAPLRWGLSKRDVRRAMARLDMRAFFVSAARGRSADAGRLLRLGLRRDPRWLLNRGVAGYLLGRPGGHG